VIVIDHIINMGSPEGRLSPKQHGLNPPPASAKWNNQIYIKPPSPFSMTETQCTYFYTCIQPEYKCKGYTSLLKLSTLWMKTVKKCDEESSTVNFLLFRWTQANDVATWMVDHATLLSGLKASFCDCYYFYRIVAPPDRAAAAHTGSVVS